MNYQDYILNEDVDIVRVVQEICATIAASGEQWTKPEAVEIAMLFNGSQDPVALFRFVDEKTGSHYVGYRTKDGREWFHILRQMRNAPGSGLLENLRNT